MATVVFMAGVVCAELPANYAATFGALAKRIDGPQLTPVEMVQSGWQATRYFAPGIEGLPFNRDRFEKSQTPGSAGLSGLFLAVHGTPVYHRFVCKILETDRSKRNLMRWLFGTETAFFRSLRDGAQLGPLMNALPSTQGVRSLLRMLIHSKDSLTRRAGLFWGSWFADAGYWTAVRTLATNDSDAVNRACAQRLLKANR